MIECKKIRYLVKCEGSMAMTPRGGKAPITQIRFLEYSEPDQITQDAIALHEESKMRSLVKEEDVKFPIIHLKEINYAIMERSAKENDEGSISIGVSLQFLDETKPPIQIRKFIHSMESHRWKQLWKQGMDAVLRESTRNLSDTEWLSTTRLSSEKDLKEYKHRLREDKRRMDKLFAEGENNERSSKEVSGSKERSTISEVSEYSGESAQQ